MTTSPSLLLRGGAGSVLRFEGGGPVTLRRTDKEHRIPLAAIQLVHAEGRSVSIVLTAPEGTEPRIYRVTDVSEAAALAFADAVTAALPAEPAPDGAALVTTFALADPPTRATRNWIVGGVVAAVIVAVDVFIALRAPKGEYAFGFLMALVLGGIGAFMVHVVGGETYRQWHLPRHGITVMGEFSHYTNNRKVYRFTDATGGRHTYTTTSGPGRIELAYDPRDPRRVVHPAGPYERIAIAFVTLLGCGIAGGSLYALGAILFVTVKG
ncbi:DUF3592 domain-containing protein [Streptomyces sp. NPDC126503]|uniref:DUF3592 domain-containing protein n=1 Tax=Streptomyces sp. NPDC126503 TaxID=3155315 RepID=UPI0033254AB6